MGKKPQGTLSLLNFVDASPWSEEGRKALQTARVSRVEVDPAESSWVVYLVFQHSLDAGEYQALQKGILSAVPSLKKIRLEVRFDLDVPLEEVWPRLGTLWDFIIQDRLAPFSWLAGACYRAEGDRLVVTLPNKVSALAVERESLDRLLASTVCEILGTGVAVDFEVVAEEQRVEESSAEIDQHFLETFSRVNKHQHNDIQWGKPVRGPVTPVKDLDNVNGQVVVEGWVFDVARRRLSNGRGLMTFNLSDNNDSIAVRIFEDDRNPEVPDLEDGGWVLLRGSCQYDQRLQEQVLVAQAISSSRREGRMDTDPVKRVELHLHTKMSSMDGLTGVDALFRQAAAWGHSAIAITDHGVVQAFPEAFEAGRKYGIKVIYGLEGYLLQDGEEPESKRRSYHIIILVKNQEGIHNLYRLVTASHLDHFYRRPRMTRDMISRHRGGLLLGTACEAGELIQAYLDGRSREKLKEIASFYDYLEVQPLDNNRFLFQNGRLPDEEHLKLMNRDLVELGRELGMPVVATGDVHFLNPEDALFRQILFAGQGYDGENQSPLYFRTTGEMLQEFQYLGNEEAEKVVIEAPAFIASQVDEVRPIPEEFYPPSLDGAEEEVVEEAHRRAATLYGSPLPDQVKERLEKELKAIIDNGFAVLYLSARRLVLRSREDGYLVGSRGSVGSSLVATLIGITEVNPLLPHYRCSACTYSEFVTDGTVGSGYDLPPATCPICGSELLGDGQDIPFEVFMGFKGDKVPDIDLNFSGDYQARAHRNAEELFGRERVFRAGTIATIAQRTSYGFVKKYLDERQIIARKAEVARLVNGLTGIKRTTGQHPGGVMVVPAGKDIHDFSPIQRPADDTGSEVITTHFDYHAISSRLVKLDLLGHDDPTVLRMLGELTGCDPLSVPLGEPAVMRLFCDTESLGVKPEEIDSPVGTLGIPEFGTRFVRQMLEETRPRTFADLVRISGFSHGTDVWLNNARNIIGEGTVALREAIATRDDIMLHLLKRDVEPATAFAVMEDVRKGKGIKPEIAEGLRAHGVPDWFLASCNKISYLFPKAHAAAYVLMAVRIAYYKVYWPEAFYAAFYTVRADEFDASLVVGGPGVVREAIADLEAKGKEATAHEKSILTILEVVREMFARGIGFERIDLCRSQVQHFTIPSRGLILPPLVALPGVGSTAAEGIDRARNEKSFTSVEDLQRRARVSRTVIEALERHGVFDGLPRSDQLTLFA